jgi:hypothetical protein
MKVNGYSLTGVRRDVASAPRVWRISTADGVLWLAEDGGRSRLIRLPVPAGDSDAVAYSEEDGRAPCEAFALAAETVAARRWVHTASALPAQPAVNSDP